MQKEGSDLQVEPTPGWMAGPQHQHPMDAWNFDLSVVEGSTEELTSGKLAARRRFDLISTALISLTHNSVRWQVSLHQLSVSSRHSTSQMSARQARWSMDSGHR